MKVFRRIFRFFFACFWFCFCWEAKSVFCFRWRKERQKKGKRNKKNQERKTRVIRCWAERERKRREGDEIDICEKKINRRGKREHQQEIFDWVSSSPSFISLGRFVPLPYSWAFRWSSSTDLQWTIRKTFVVDPKDDKRFVTSDDSFVVFENDEINYAM